MAQPIKKLLDNAHIECYYTFVFIFCHMNLLTSNTSEGTMNRQNHHAGAAKYIMVAFLFSLSILSIASHSVYSQGYYLEANKFVQSDAIYETGCGLTPDKTMVTLTVTGMGDCPTGGPLDIMLIMDRSTTMLINSRIDSAKAAAQAFVDLLRDEDRAGLVSFAGDVTLDKDLTSMNAVGKIELKAAIDGISAHGYTNIGDAIRLSNDHLENYGRNGKAWVEILLSDGLPNRPLTSSNHITYTIAAADTARMLHVPVYTIGLALDVQEGIDLLQAIADTTGARYFDSPTPNDLRQIYLEIGGEVLCKAGTDITVTEVVQSTFLVDDGFTITPTSIEEDPVLGTTLTWNIDELFVGDMWSVSFDIRSPQPGVSRPVNVVGPSKVTYTRNGDQLEAPFPQAFVTINPCEIPILDCQKVDLFPDNGDLQAGDTLRYEIVASNTGIVSATSVVFNDTPDPYTTLIVGSVTTTHGTVVTGNTPGDQRVSVSIGIVTPLDEITIRFQVVIDDPLPPQVTFLSNQGFFSSLELDLTPTDDPDTPEPDDPTLTSLGISPMLEGTKRDVLVGDRNGDGLPGPGDTLRYEIEILNDGAGTALGVTFVDTLETNIGLIAGSVVGSQGSVVLGNDPLDTLVFVHLGTLPGGATASIDFLVSIHDPLPWGITELSNQGLIRSIETEDEPTDDPDTPEDDDPTVTRSFRVIFKRGVNFDLALASTYCPYYRVYDGPKDGPALIQITTYTYDPGHDLYWCDPIKGHLYPGSHLYITYTFKSGSPVDSIFTHIPAKGTSNSERHPEYRAAGPHAGLWEKRTWGDYDYYGYDWTVYDEARKDDGLWRIVSEIYFNKEGLPQLLPDTTYIILDTEDPVYHLTYRKASDGTPLPTILHPSLGDIPVTTDEEVIITTMVDQTVALEGNGRLWSWMDIFVFARGEKVDIDGVPAYANHLHEVSRWVNDPPFADTLDYNYVWNVRQANSSCEGVATVRIKGRDTASNLVDIEDGEPNTGLHVLVDVKPPAGPDASKIVITNMGSVVGEPGAVGVDWFDLGLMVKVYDDPSLHSPLMAFEARSDGSFNTSLPFSPSAGSLLFVTASDRAGHESEPTPLVVSFGSAALEAYKSATVIGDGEANPGDALLYEITLLNADDVTLTEVVFTDVPGSYTNLVVGSVATTQGTIASGNGHDDVYVVVEVGSVTSGESVVISFQVSIDAAFPEDALEVSNQGVVSSAELPLVSTDDPSTIASDDPTLTPVVPTTVSVTYHLLPGWNTLSIPVIPEDPNMWHLFPDAQTIWAYDGGYIETDQIIPGMGYFLFYNIEITVTITGTPVKLYTKDLNYGWNLIGSVIEEVPVSGIINTDTGQPATESCLDPTAVYEYRNERYFFATRIEPAKAFWAFAFADCPIEVSAETAKMYPTGHTLAKKTDWTGTLFLSAGENSQILEFGLADAADPGYDPGLDLLLPPPSPKDDFSIAYLADSNQGRLRFRRDIRGRSDLNWSLHTQSDERVTLGWNLDQIPTNQTALFVKENGETVDMKHETALILPEGQHVLHIRIRTLPQNFTLSQNIPNPFNPTTTISYTITGREHKAMSERKNDGSMLHALRTTLKIYNLLGQEVRTLVNEVQEPGRYTTTWDGRNDSGDEVPSGVYFYRLQAGEYMATRHMLLLK